MKQSPETQKAQDNMQPGVITVQGFIGPDHRDLVEILDEDANTVKKLGLTHRQIADKMHEFKEAGLKGLDEFIHVEPHFEVRVSTVRGGLRCPFEDHGMIPKSNIQVKNLDNNTSIDYTDMSIHFISQHGFYQGKGSPYRTPPEKLAEVLEIKAETDTQQ